MLLILSVDDEPVICDDLKLILEQDLKCRVETAHNAQQAFEHLNARKYDLIVSDHRMPGMTGGEMIKKLRSEKGYNQDVPVIMLSGFIPDAKVSCEDFENILFLDKPYDPERLIKYAKMSIFSSVKQALSIKE